MMESPVSTLQTLRKQKSPIQAAGKGRMRIFLLLNCLWILGSGIYFLMLDSTGLEYYKHVDEVTSNLAAWQNKTMQIHGFVTPGSIKKWFDPQHQQIHYQFQIENCGKMLLANFSGLVPDTFQENAEVVLKGKITPQSSAGWIIEAKEVLGKCPSKYSQDQEHIQERNQRCIREHQEKSSLLERHPGRHEVLLAVHARKTFSSHSLAEDRRSPLWNL